MTPQSETVAAPCRPRHRLAIGKGRRAPAVDDALRIRRREDQAYAKQTPQTVRTYTRSVHTVRTRLALSSSVAWRAGEPVKVISERLGHEAPAFTLSQYAHVIPGMHAEAASQIAALVRRG